MTNHITEEERTNPIGLARYAYEYIDAAIVVDRTIGERAGYEIVSPIPAYYLALHGIELTLKAFLRFHGISVHDLSSKKYGHDLRACYRKSKEFGLCSCFQMTEEDLRAMDMLIELNRNQGLRYIKTGYKQFPSWAIVMPLAVRLHQAIAPLVGYKSFDMTFSN